MAEDDVLFAYIKYNSVICILFVCDTFLHSEGDYIYGKLMYSNNEVHNNYTLQGKMFEQKMYSCAYKYTKSRLIRPLTDEELQKVGKSLSLICGDGLNKHLCRAHENSKTTLLNTPLFLQMYSSQEAKLLANEIGFIYGVNPCDLRITGGLHLFPSPIEKSHDIDIVIPIDSGLQLKQVLYHIRSNNFKPVSEYGYTWPLRWYSLKGHLICPFFVYRNLKSPIQKLEYCKVNYKGRVKIRDDSYGIFNAPLLKTEDDIDLVLCRSTLLRGMIRNGQEMVLDCPQYIVTEGAFSGSKVGLITNPFIEITNIKDILDDYKT